MTTVIGIQYPDKCVLYADSVVISNATTPFKHRSMVKIAKRGQYLIAAAGDFRVLQFVHHIWEPPTPTQDDLKDTFHFMISSVMPSLRDDFKENGFDTQDKDDKGERSLSFSLLLCLNGTIFDIDEDLTVTLSDTNFYGIGSGGDYALGALHAGATALKAMEIADKLDINTQPPFIKRSQERLLNGKPASKQQA
jgi:ATP-dependent protease HslVU (ClpYQ) peptidase subunit